MACCLHAINLLILNDHQSGMYYCRYISGHGRSELCCDTLITIFIKSSAEREKGFHFNGWVTGLLQAHFSVFEISDL